jgi:hypothetical protein
MDSEQIQQQMRVRRAAIDARLDDLHAATIAASRRSAIAVLLVASAGVLAMVWVRRRARHAGSAPMARGRRGTRPTSQPIRLANSG